MKYIKLVNPCLAHQNAAVSKWPHVFFLSNFSSDGSSSFTEPSQHYRDLPDHKETPWGERTHAGMEMNELYSLPFSSCSLLQQYWDTVQAAAANGGCDQCVIRSGEGSSSAGTEKSRFGLFPNSSTEATRALVSQHWGFGQWWKASWNDKSHCHFNAFTNPELEGPKDYAKLN